MDKHNIPTRSISEDMFRRYENMSIEDRKKQTTSANDKCRELVKDGSWILCGDKLTRPSGKEHPSWTDKITITCMQCGKTKEVSPCYKDRKFCTSRCSSIWHSAENNPSWKEKVVITCLQCGKTKEIVPSDKDRKFCDKECMGIWYSENIRGENHPLWTGGGSEYENIRQSFEYKQWRQLVFKRDNYICQFCNDKTGGNLQAHHIKRFVDYPELRFDVDNGITLCKECHTKISGKEEQFEERFKEIIKIP